MIKQLTDTVNNLGGKLEQQESSLGNVQKQTEIDRVRQIDTHFDTLSDKVPELGKTASLSQKEIQNRIFVVNTAKEAMRVYGVSDKEALTMGVKALTGQKSEASVKNKLVRELDKNKKRFTARGRSRNRPDKKRSTQDRAMEQINAILDSDEY
jgi:ssDNA-specific exonuclease RecJ